MYASALVLTGLRGFNAIGDERKNFLLPEHSLFLPLCFRYVGRLLDAIPRKHLSPLGYSPSFFRLQQSRHGLALSKCPASRTVAETKHSTAKSPEARASAEESTTAIRRQVVCQRTLAKRV